MPENPIEQPAPQELQAAAEAYERAAADGLCEIGAMEIAREARPTLKPDQSVYSAQE